jgi:hypothetical protein
VHNASDGTRVARVAGPWQDGERVRRNLGFVGERHADGLGPDIEAEGTHGAIHIVRAARRRGVREQK